MAEIVAGLLIMGRYKKSNSWALVESRKIEFGIGNAEKKILRSGNFLDGQIHSKECPGMIFRCGIYYFRYQPLCHTVVYNVRHSLTSSQPLIKTENTILILELFPNFKIVIREIRRHTIHQATGVKHDCDMRVFRYDQENLFCVLS